MQFAQFYGHPAFAAILAPKAAPLLRRVAESMRISADEVVPTDDEIAQMQQQATQAAQQQPQQPDDPRLQTAMIRAQTDLKRAELQAAANAQDMEFRARMAQQDQAAKAAELNLLREIEMMKLASTQKLTLEQIRSQLAQTAIKERGKQQLFSAERQLKLSQGSGI
jgi:DNA-directed RNA polymerase alpha subunit